MKKRRLRKVYIIIAVLLIASLVGAGLYAKYVTSVNMDLKVVFSAELAQEFDLLEYKTSRSSDGSYQLDTEHTVRENTFALMPGVDIPKVPFVKIVGKSDVDAYLYVEVVSSEFPSTVTYSIDKHWLLLDGTVGPHGGKVYVYSQDGINPLVLDRNFTQDKTVILNEDANRNTVFVSDSFVAGDGFTLNLNFYAYMAQIIPEKTCEQIFVTNFKTT